MDIKDELAVWVELADLAYQQGADGQESEKHRLMAELVEQSKRNPLDGLH